MAIDISGSMGEYILSLNTESLVSQIGINNINNRILGLPTMNPLVHLIKFQNLIL